MRGTYDPDGPGGKDPIPVTITYNPDHTTTQTTGTGPTATIITTNTAGDTISLRSGPYEYTKFNNAGQPTQGTYDPDGPGGKDPIPVTITYNPDHTTTQTTGTGPTATIITTNTAGDTISLRSGPYEYTKFNNAGQPTQGTYDPDGPGGKDPIPVTITYNPDHTTTQTTGTGPTATIITTNTAGDTISLRSGPYEYTKFNNAGQPTQGTYDPDGPGGKDPIPVTITYNPDHTTTQTTGTGPTATIITTNTAGDTISLRSGPYEYTKFNNAGQPTQGTYDPDGPGGKDPIPVTITYNPDHTTTQTTGTGPTATIITTNTAGDTISLRSGPYEYTKFNNAGQPTQGTYDPDGPGGKDPIPVTITYNPDKTSRMNVGDKDYIEFNADNVPVVVVRGGVTYTDFDQKTLRPTKMISEGVEYRIAYLPGDQTKYQTKDGSWVRYDGNGAPVTIGKGDKTLITFATDLPKLLDGIQYVKHRRFILDGFMTELLYWIRSAPQLWTGPAADAYREYMNEVVRSSEHLMRVLDEAIVRMQTTYDNYVNVETRNANNLRSS
ncbi:WXG100 family type VII secretion target [Dactylosporangium sp. CA-152071]|uniref:WXG100 family type VII secretion target n=1 Tax=Dactylosporangium sp. CA-152071 TaxID=3239933 RepID=UPI003D8A81D0